MFPDVKSVKHEKQKIPFESLIFNLEFLFFSSCAKFRLWNLVETLKHCSAQYVEYVILTEILYMNVAKLNFKK